MPVILVLASVLAVVDGSHLQHAVHALAIAAERRAAALVLFVAGDGGLLSLGVRVRGNGAQGEEASERSGGRHFERWVASVVGGGKKVCLLGILFTRGWRV